MGTENARTDHVLIVHGTWNPPDAKDPPKWYQRRSASSKGAPPHFCEELQRSLGEHGMSNAVWRDQTAGAEFGWSGDNDHLERVKAAQALCTRFEHIAATDPGNLRRRGRTTQLHFCSGAATHSSGALLRDRSGFARRPRPRRCPQALGTSPPDNGVFVG